MDMRRTLDTSQMTPTIDPELNQQNILPEPSYAPGNLSLQRMYPELSLLGHSNFNPASISSMVTALRNVTPPEIQHFSFQGNGAMLYGMSQYNSYRIERAQDIRVATADDLCFTYLTSRSSTEPFTSSRNYGLGGIPADPYVRNSHFIEIRCPYKIRFTEWAPVNFQCHNSSRSSQPLIAPSNLGLYCARSHLAGGGYMVQPFSQQEVRSGFQHSPSTMPWHSDHQHPLPQLNLPGGRGQHGSFFPQLPPGPPFGSAYGVMHRQVSESEPRQTRDVPPSDQIVPETVFQQMNVLWDEVSMLEAYIEGSDSSDDVGDFADPDPYRDMRMDVGHMSYEELLALEARIGNVKTGLSEETIMSQLKIRTSIPRNINLEEPASKDEETDCCTICLDVMDDGKKIGILDCGHCYHADCLKQWLLTRNLCPICKSEALTLSKKRNRDTMTCE